MKIYTNEMIRKINEKKQKRKKIIKYFCLPFLAIIVVFIADILFQKFIQNRDNIEFFGYKPLIVMTGSMEPSINIGDMVIVKQTEQNNIQIGDVITYTVNNGKESVTHRVIEIIEKNGEKFYRTKGDNNNVADPDIVSYENVLGKVDFQIEGVGKIIAYIFTGTGLGAIALLVLMHYSISSDRRIRVIARQEARRLYNVPKYNKKEEAL